MRAYLCDHLLTPDGWRSPGRLDVDDGGAIAYAGPPEQAPDGAPARLVGAVIPAMPNLHSHAFQRALSGRTEHLGPDRDADSFWTWREAMYDLALRLDPDHLEAIAAMLYVEMLEAGQTAVGEFHYLHHPPDGSRYAEPAEMALRVIAAAEQTGISATLLPVLYLSGGFERPALPEQRRFTCASVDELLELRRRAAAHAAGRPLLSVGLAPHSLRAVPPDALRDALVGLFAEDPEARVHVHVAEQALEVEGCRAARGARPVRWLLDEVGLDPRWCAVHATHLDDGEVHDLATSGAVVGLCPTTEANLGDGLFRGADFLEAGGHFGVGSDSHVTVSASDELRVFEYGQRLLHEQRNLLAGHEPDGERHLGLRLWARAAAGGARALRQPIGALEAGRRADFVVLDPSHPRLVGHGPETLLDAFVFAAADGAIAQVFVAGRRVVDGGRHFDRPRVEARFARAVRSLYV